MIREGGHLYSHQVSSRVFKIPAGTAVPAGLDATAVDKVVFGKCEAVRGGAVPENHDPSAPRSEEGVSFHQKPGRRGFEINSAPVWTSLVLATRVKVCVYDRVVAVHSPDDNLC